MSITLNVISHGVKSAGLGKILTDPSNAYSSGNVWNVAPHFRKMAEPLGVRLPERDYDIQRHIVGGWNIQMFGKNPTPSCSSLAVMQADTAINVLGALTKQSELAPVLAKLSGLAVLDMTGRIFDVFETAYAWNSPEVHNEKASIIENTIMWAIGEYECPAEVESHLRATGSLNPDNLLAKALSFNCEKYSSVRNALNYFQPEVELREIMDIFGIGHAGLTDVNIRNLSTNDSFATSVITPKTLSRTMDIIKGLRLLPEWVVLMHRFTNAQKMLERALKICDLVYSLNTRIMINAALLSFVQEKPAT